MGEGGGGNGTTKTRLSVSTPESKCHCECQGEKEEGWIWRGGGRGGGAEGGGLFVRARTGRTQVIREAEADASGGLGHCRMGETGLDRFRFLPLKLGRVQTNDVKKVQMVNRSDWTWTLRPLNNLDMVH